ncbi:integrase arm-type DNA-binding domain-containing protein [Ramlibacter ginsenosidimutans]|uniref:Integrase arm-type DNA-binding domain-containing protein n=1 Tax=Ramlibacter ginsenosidimutans TaxID=502333 RepID=A0A934TWJ9_9BURK|nr:site-specific integrase [Ramlibacter ginsenosidimutans]MBK6008813.1 integrase arm-type DNA-binding domain-containing protein [Ramlibacter ginsenosidimutans]
MRVAKELGALQVQRLRDPGFHAIGGVPGLMLRITASGSRSWVLRATVGSRRRDMGLGGYPGVTLAAAREKAREARALIDKSVDPILARKQARSALIAEQAKAKTFDQAVTAFMDAKGDEWRNAKHRQQWQNTLAQYASPIMGKVLVSDVTQAHVEAVLRPIWREKTETATRVRQRIEKVLDFARVSGWREGENPARWRGHLAELFPTPSKIKTVVSQRYRNPREMHDLMVTLRAAKGTAARALELLILTAARSGEVRGAVWSEVDMQSGVWAIPAARMKAHKEHRVPLSRDALELLKSLPRIEGNSLLFPAPRGGVMSDMTMTAVLRRLQVDDATVHGMRSSFRVWTQDHTSYPREMAEVALAHAVGSAVEQAYARSDLLERRRKLMQDWADFLAKPAGTGARVTPIRAA